MRRDEDRTLGCDIVWLYLSKQTAALEPEDSLMHLSPVKFSGHLIPFDGPFLLCLFSTPLCSVLHLPQHVITFPQVLGESNFFPLKAKFLNLENNEVEFSTKTLILKCGGTVNSSLWPILRVIHQSLYHSCFIWKSFLDWLTLSTLNLPTVLWILMFVWTCNPFVILASQLFHDITSVTFI